MIYNINERLFRCILMIKLIKKGGLRERANRSRTYQGSENTETTLKPNRYVQTKNESSDSNPSPSAKNLNDQQNQI